MHSDCGSQYCLVEYPKLLRNNHLICSMSKRQNYYDNTAMKSRNRSFKVEVIHVENLKRIMMKKIYV